MSTWQAPDIARGCRGAAVAASTHLCLGDSMRFTLFVVMAAATAYGGSKIAFLNTSRAILETSDGRRASAELMQRFAPEKDRLSLRETEIRDIERLLGSPPDQVTAAARERLKRDVEDKRRELVRINGDLRAQVDRARNQVLAELHAKLMKIVDAYAKKKKFTVVIDTSDPATPVVWRADAADITAQIVKLYEQAHSPH